MKTRYLDAATLSGAPFAQVRAALRRWIRDRPRPPGRFDAMLEFEPADLPAPSDRPRPGGRPATGTEPAGARRLRPRAGCAAVPIHASD